MLSYLRITNLAILEDVTLEPGRGFNVLSGETGAGKSIIVDGIGLLLGERGSADLIRSGAGKLSVEAQFEIPAGSPARAAAGNAGVGDPGGAWVLRRELEVSDGSLRSRAFINDRLVTLATLRGIAEHLADLHGQHQHQSLLRPEGQRAALDRAAGAEDLLREVGTLHGALRDLTRERDALMEKDRQREGLEENLDRRIEEIEQVDPRPGEEEDLRREESLLRHAEEIAELAGEVHRILEDDDDSVSSRLGRARHRLERLAAIDPEAARAGDLVEEARVAASEASRAVAAYLDAEGQDAARLDQVAGRIAAIARLTKKYGPTVEDVLAVLATARADREALGGAPERLARLEEECAATRSRYMAAARRLSQRRRKAAARLSGGVARELEALAMEGTRIEIVVDQEENARPSPEGIDRIAFLLAANRGEELRPISRVASGGELSRLMLALRNATEAPASGDRDDRRTLIFDEVDAGVGGRVAEAVGQRLARLSRGQQVLCVTHLPQIAAFAETHFHVTKRAAAGRTRAQVLRLDEAGRIEELARMLGGEPPDTARRHAAALVGRRGRPGR